VETATCLARWSFGLGLTSLLSLLLLAPLAAFAGSPALLGANLLAALPAVALGHRARARSHAGADLAGAGVGALTALVVINSLGAVGGIFLAASVGAWAALLLAAGAARWRRWAYALTGLAALGGPLVGALACRLGHQELSSRTDRGRATGSGWPQRTAGGGPAVSPRSTAAAHSTASTILW